MANAVFDAAGVRVRDFPFTIEKVLPACRSWKSDQGDHDDRSRGHNDLPAASSVQIS